MSDEAQTVWVICYEFHLTPAQVFDMPADDFAFLVHGLEWWKIKEKEALEHARH